MTGQMIKVFHVHPIDTKDLKMKEFQFLINLFQNDKDTGLDEVPRGVENWFNEELSICKKVFHGYVPDQYKI